MNPAERSTGPRFPIAVSPKSLLPTIKRLCFFAFTVQNPSFTSFAQHNPSNALSLPTIERLRVHVSRVHATIQSLIIGVSLKFFKLTTNFKFQILFSFNFCFVFVSCLHFSARLPKCPPQNVS